jgi:hypothetical protein
LFETSAPSEKASFSSLLRATIGIDDQLRMFLLQEDDHLKASRIAEVGFDIVSNRFKVLRQLIHDLLE